MRKDDDIVVNVNKIRRTMEAPWEKKSDRGRADDHVIIVARIVWETTTMREQLLH